MVIKEKALIREMKEAYKAAGYTVSGKETATGTDLILQTPTWKVVIAKENMPRKVLALIVEHLGAIPMEGESFQLRKGDTQTVITETVNTPIIPDAQETEQIKPTVLSWKGRTLWQREGDGRIFVLPDCEDMLDKYGRAVFVHGNDTISLTGMISAIYMMVDNKVIPDSYRENLEKAIKPEK